MPTMMVMIMPTMMIVIMVSMVMPESMVVVRSIWTIRVQGTVLVLLLVERTRSHHEDQGYSRNSQQRKNDRKHTTLRR
jgi:hypothetical protein